MYFIHNFYTDWFGEIDEHMDDFSSPHIVRMPIKQILLAGVPFPGTHWLGKKSLMMNTPYPDKVAWEDIFEFMSGASGLPRHLFEINIGSKRVRYQHLDCTPPFRYDNHVMFHRDGTPSSQAFLQIGLNTSLGRHPIIGPKNK